MKKHVMAYVWIGCYLTFPVGAFGIGQLVDYNPNLPSGHYSLGIGGFNPTGGAVAGVVLPNLGAIYFDSLIAFAPIAAVRPDLEGAYMSAPVIGAGNLTKNGAAFKAHVGLGFKLSERQEVSAYFWETSRSSQTFGNTTVTTMQGYRIFAPEINSRILIFDLMLEPVGKKAVTVDTFGGVYSCYSTYYCGGATKEQSVRREYLSPGGHVFFLRPKIRFQSFHDFLYQIDDEIRHFTGFSYFDIGPIVSLDFKEYGGWFEWGLLSSFTMKMGLGYIYRPDMALSVADSSTTTNQVSNGIYQSTTTYPPSAATQHYIMFLFTMEIGWDSK